MAFAREFYFGSPYRIKATEGLYSKMGIKNKFNVAEVYKRGVEIYKKAMNNDIKDSDLTNDEKYLVGIIRQLSKAGTSFGTEQEWNEMNEVRDERRKKLDEVQAEKETAFGRFKQNYSVMADSMENFLFKEYGTGLKVITGVLVYHWLQKKMATGGYSVSVAEELTKDITDPVAKALMIKDLTNREIAKIASEYVNANYGGLNLQRYRNSESVGVRAWFHPTVQLLKRFMLLPPDWTESNLVGLKKALTADNEVERALYRRFYKQTIFDSLT